MGRFGVATWSFEVATWGRLPGRVATSARPASARPALAVRVTWALRAQCARDLVSWCVHCAPNPVL